MTAIDLTQLITAEQKAEAARSLRANAIKSEVSRRIYAVLDAPTVSNVQGAMLAGELSEAETAVFKLGRRWVDTMLARSRDMAQDPNAEYLRDDAWPDLPVGVRELAAKY